jgi:hypothetical protein
MLLGWTVGFAKGRVLGAVAAAAFTAAVFVQLDATPRAAQSSVMAPTVAGETMMRLLSDEHAAIAGYLTQEAAARTQADQTAAHDLDAMKLAALEEAQSSRLRLAQVSAPAREEKPKAVIVRVTSGAAVNGAPMQLVAMTAPPPVQAQAREQAPGPVRGRLRQLASTVERIPSWFSSAAGWVADAVPVPRLPMSPMSPMLPQLPQLPQLPVPHFRV